jgi:hypothetical protein
MKLTIDMARAVYGAHTEWTGAPLDRLEQLVALARADEREQGQKWFDAVLEQHRIVVLAEREACAKTKAGKPRKLKAVGLGTLLDEQQFCFDKGWCEGAASVRAAIRARGQA